MDRNSVNWRGYIPAITTPFDSDGELDTGAFKNLLLWLLEQGMHGVIILGTTGEWFSLKDGERNFLLQLAGETLHGKMTLIAGCHSYTAAGAIENAALAAHSGFDGVLITPPPYIKPSEREIYTFYEQVSNGIGLPICAYNWPPGTNVDMSVSLLTKLADLDNVVAIKDSTGDLRHFLDVFFTLNNKVRVFGVPLNEMGITLVRHNNADGTMGAGAVLGSDQPNFYNSLWAGNLEAAREFGQRDVKIMSDWFHTDYTGKFGSAQAIFKEALNQQGLPGGFPRRPVLPLEQDGVNQIRATLAELGRI